MDFYLGWIFIQVELFIFIKCFLLILLSGFLLNPLNNFYFLLSGKGKLSLNHYCKKNGEEKTSR